MILAEIKPLYLVLVIGAVFIINFVAAMRCYKKCGPDEALVRTGFGGASVVFGSGTVVIPIMHDFVKVKMAAKQLDFSVKIITEDLVRKEVNCNFIVRVNKTKEDVCTALTMLGVERLEDDNKLLKLFEPKYSEYIQVVAKTYTAEEIESKPMTFKESVLEIIGVDVNGLSLEDMTLTVM